LLAVARGLDLDPFGALGSAGVLVRTRVGWTARDQDVFWTCRRAMPVPDSLSHKKSFRAHGRVFRESAELFSEISWV
jgi:hypothetical protein